MNARMRTIALEYFDPSEAKAPIEPRRRCRDCRQSITPEFHRDYGRCLSCLRRAGMQTIDEREEAQLLSKDVVYRSSQDRIKDLESALKEAGARGLSLRDAARAAGMTKGSYDYVRTLAGMSDKIETYKIRGMRFYRLIGSGDIPESPIEGAVDARIALLEAALSQAGHEGLSTAQCAEAAEISVCHVSRIVPRSSRVEGFFVKGRRFYRLRGAE